jgi:hypothetical protein
MQSFQRQTLPPELKSWLQEDSPDTPILLGTEKTEKVESTPEVDYLKTHPVYYTAVVLSFFFIALTVIIKFCL